MQAQLVSEIEALEKRIAEKRGDNKKSQRGKNRQFCGDTYKFF